MAYFGLLLAAFPLWGAMTFARRDRNIYDRIGLVICLLLTVGVVLLLRAL